MKFLYVIFFTVSFNLFGQIGINTNQPKASLDIQAKNDNSDGLLIPIISKFPNTQPSHDQNSMLVYYDNTSPENYGYKGFYWWDNENSIWQYIFQSKMVEMNLFKVITKSNSSSSIPNGTEYNNIWFKTKFDIIEAPNANYKLDNGDLIIGKSGLYSINFSGQVGKVKGSETATLTEVGIFINNNTLPDFISSTPLPSADNGDRYATHSISNIKFLSQGDRISIKTRRTTDVNTSFNYSKNYILTLSLL